MKQLFTVRINVDINPPANHGYGMLRVAEEVQVEADGFLDVCKVLSEFHDLAETLKSRNKKA